MRHYRKFPNRRLIIGTAAVVLLVGLTGAGMLAHRYWHHFFPPPPPKLPPASRPSDDPAAGLATFTDLQSKISAAHDGARMVLPPGRYTGGANFDGKSGITVEAQTPNTVVLEGSPVLGGEKITLKGLVIQKVITPLQVGAVVTGPDWVMEDCTVQDNESVGVTCSGPRSVLRRVRAIRNGYMGFGCGSSDGKPFPGPKLYDCESAWNNTGQVSPGWKFDEQSLLRNGLYYISPGWESGGGKFCLADGLVIEGMKSHDNGGPGIWLDVYNLAATIKDCEVFNNFGVDNAWEGAGIAIEISKGPTLLENCYSHDNMGSAYAIWESQNVTIHNCIAGGTGIEFRDLDGDRRNSGWFCRNVVLDSVRFYGSNSEVNYWKNQSSSWREDYHIEEKDLQFGLKGKPQWPVK